MSRRKIKIPLEGLFGSIPMIFHWVGVALNADLGFKKLATAIPNQATTKTYCGIFSIYIFFVIILPQTQNPLQYIITEHLKIIARKLLSGCVVI